MNITAVIAEYDPFHNGHAYQLREARRLTGADYILVVMNGDFMQRGLPACWNKYSRACMALQNGADAVLELPVLYGTASAEFFAYGGVRLLHQLGCIDQLCFGCETDDLVLLQRIADLLLSEPDVYQSTLHQCLSQGMSFPKARMQGILAVFKNEDLLTGHMDLSKLNVLLNSPNTILGIEYLKALRTLDSPIRPVPCRRMDEGYHAETLSAPYAPATAIRKEYIQNGCTPALKQTIPPSVYDYLKQACQTSAPITMEDFYPYLQYALWKPSQSLTDYLDIHDALANRITECFRPEASYSELMHEISCKQLTNTRIQRAFLHILLDIKKEEAMRQLSSGSMHYARLLAVHRNAFPLLKKLKHSSEIPIINRLASGKRRLETAGNHMGVSLLNLDISSAFLYELVKSQKYGIPAVNEYTKGILFDDSCHE